MTEGSEQMPRGQENAGKRERVLSNGLHLVEQIANFGHGKIEIVQVIPPKIEDESGRISARKQIFIPGYRPSWADQPNELEADLIMLAEINEELGRDVITTGVAFIGDRKHSGSLVSDVKKGVDITVSQYEKAQDFVKGVMPLVIADNAEVAAHSLGGTIALAANDLGLPVDTIGLFNSAGLYKTDKDELLFEKIPETIKGVSKASFTRVKNILERRTERRGARDRRAILNRILESRVNNYAAYRSLVSGYLFDTEGKKVIVGSSENDKVYPRAQVRAVLSSQNITPNPNIELVDLPWNGHNLGKSNTLQRRQRLETIAKVMFEANH